MNHYFAVFGYDQYYPSGGDGDLQGTFVTREDAEFFVNKHRGRRDYLEIVDLRDWLRGVDPTWEY